MMKNDTYWSLVIGMLTFSFFEFPSHGLSNSPCITSIAALIGISVGLFVKANAFIERLRCLCTKNDVDASELFYRLTKTSREISSIFGICMAGAYVCAVFEIYSDGFIRFLTVVISASLLWVLIFAFAEIAEGIALRIKRKEVEGAMSRDHKKKTD